MKHFAIAFGALLAATSSAQAQEAKTPALCWQEYYEDLDSCASEFPGSDGPTVAARIMCYTVATSELNSCLGTVPPQTPPTDPGLDCFKQFKADQKACRTKFSPPPTGGGINREKYNECLNGAKRKYDWCKARSPEGQAVANLDGVLIAPCEQPEADEMHVIFDLTSTELVDLDFYITTFTVDEYDVVHATHTWVASIPDAETGKYDIDLPLSETLPETGDFDFVVVASNAGSPEDVCAVACVPSSICEE